MFQNEGCRITASVCACVAHFPEIAVVRCSPHSPHFLFFPPCHTTHSPPPPPHARVFSLSVTPTQSNLWSICTVSLPLEENKKKHKKLKCKTKNDTPQSSNVRNERRCIFSATSRFLSSVFFSYFVIFLFADAQSLSPQSTPTPDSTSTFLFIYCCTSLPCWL